MAVIGSAINPAIAASDLNVVIFIVVTLNGVGCNDLIVFNEKFRVIATLLMHNHLTANYLISLLAAGFALHICEPNCINFLSSQLK